MYRRLSSRHLVEHKRERKLLFVLRHLQLNSQWFKTFFRGRNTAPKILGIAVNHALIVVFAVVTITGLFLSRYLLSDIIPIELHRNLTVHRLHAALSYWLLILVGLHIGLNWQGMAAKILPPCLNGKIGQVLAAILALVGIYGSFALRLGDRLVMKHVIGGAALNWPLPLYATTIVGIMALYAVIARRIARFFKTNPHPPTTL